MTRAIFSTSRSDGAGAHREYRSHASTTTGGRISNIAWIALAVGIAGPAGAQASDEQLRPPPIVARPDEVAASPDRFLGHRIRIEDVTVEEVLTARSSVITVAGARQGTLAVALPFVPRGTSLPRKLPLVVTGRVWLTQRVLLVAWPVLTSEWDALQRFQEKPIVVADSVRARDGAELAAPPPVESIERIVAAYDAAGLLDRSVDLPAVTVHEVITARSFEASGAAGHRVLVDIAADRAPALRAGDTVRVRGVVRLQGAAIYPWSLLPGAGTLLGRVLYVAASEVEKVTGDPTR